MADMLGSPREYSYIITDYQNAESVRSIPRWRFFLSPHFDLQTWRRSERAWHPKLEPPDTAWTIRSKNLQNKHLHFQPPSYHRPSYLNSASHSPSRPRSRLIPNTKYHSSNVPSPAHAMAPPHISESTNLHKVRYHKGRIFKTTRPLRKIDKRTRLIGPRRTYLPLISKC
jgi:hypothetical protein